MSVESVNPWRCRMWEMHDRLGAEINSDSCQPLLKSLQQNGQKQPVLARRIPEDGEYQYELVYGARRLFAARHLGIELLVAVRNIDDRAALIDKLVARGATVLHRGSEGPHHWTTFADLEGNEFCL